MYTSFFNFKCSPFQLTPDPEFLYLSREHRKALTYLNYGIPQNAGFILITGEIGAGKTTIIRNIIKGLKEGVRLAFIKNTQVTSEQLIAMINEDFGIETKGRDKIQMLRDLSDFLIAEYARGGKCMLIIDESQNLSASLLEEVRLLSNLETAKAKLLQIILVGQPELKRTLNRPDLRQLKQRISISCHINPLTRGEIEGYIFHRLTVAGNRDAVIFGDGTMDLIYTYSRGLPRLINIVCDYLLLSAFTEEKRDISADLVKEVIGDLDTDNAYWHDEVSHKNADSAGAAEDATVSAGDVETGRQSQGISQEEKRDILYKISLLENLIATAIDKFGFVASITESKKLEARFNEIFNEIESLKERVAEFERPPLEETETDIKKRKNFWGRIFN